MHTSVVVQRCCLMSRVGFCSGNIFICCENMTVSSRSHRLLCDWLKQKKILQPHKRTELCQNSDILYKNRAPTVKLRGLVISSVLAGTGICFPYFSPGPLISEGQPCKRLEAEAPVDCLMLDDSLSCWLAVLHWSYYIQQGDKGSSWASGWSCLGPADSFERDHSDIWIIDYFCQIVCVKAVGRDIKNKITCLPL